MTNKKLKDVFEQAIDTAVSEGLQFPLVLIAVSPKSAEVLATEISLGKDGRDYRDLCNNLSAGTMEPPIILYLSDRSGETSASRITAVPFC